jgi:hypothetical protein
MVRSSSTGETATIIPTFQSCAIQMRNASPKLQDVHFFLMHDDIQPKDHFFTASTDIGASLNRLSAQSLESWSKKSFLDPCFERLHRRTGEGCCCDIDHQRVQDRQAISWKDRSSQNSNQPPMQPQYNACMTTTAAAVLRMSQEVSSLRWGETGWMDIASLSQSQSSSSHHEGGSVSSRKGVGSLGHFLRMYCLDGWVIP